MEHLSGVLLGSSPNMWPYLFLFFVSAFLAALKLRAMPTPMPGRRIPVTWRNVFVLLVLMIGLRHEVGGDWQHYLDNIEWASGETFSDSFAGGRDPADGILNWIAAQSGLGAYLLNSVYAIFFSMGLVAFCRSQPRPWLALTVAVPYLITVVAMGYSRQGAAIGLAMMGLVALENKRVMKFLLLIILAAMFHRSAVVLIPLAILADSRRRISTLFWVVVTVAVLFYLLLQEHIETFISGYIDAAYESSGASIRIAMNAVPALLLLLARKRFGLLSSQSSFWTWMAWGALAFVAILYVSPSSTAVDRLALYWIPLQLFVWSRFPDAMGRPGARNAFWVYAVILYSATVYVVWLFFAVHSEYWIPYKFYPMVWLWQ
jgi:hypothetical protein